MILYILILQALLPPLPPHLRQIIFVNSHVTCLVDLCLFKAKSNMDFWYAPAVNAAGTARGLAPSDTMHRKHFPAAMSERM